MNINKNSLLFKVSILSISGLLMLAPVVSATLPLMYNSFPTLGKSAVETLLTVPNFGIIAGLFISPLFVRISGPKVTIMAGLALALIAGIYPSISGDYITILVSRFLLGLGIGLFNSLAVSLLSQFYSGNQLSSMMGLQSMVGGLGSALSAFVVGYLVTISWHAAFAIYLVILPVLCLFGLVVRLEKPNVSTKNARQTKVRQTINAPVVTFAVLIFFLYVFFMMIVIKLPELIISKHIGTASEVSIISGMTTLVGIPTGILYGKVYKKLGDKVPIISFISMSIGFLILAIANGVFGVIIGVLFSGIGFGLSIPFINTKIAQVAPKGSTNIAYTVILILTNAGVFCSPVILNSLGRIAGNTTPQFSMIISSVGFLVLFFILLIIQLKNKGGFKNDEH